MALRFSLIRRDIQNKTFTIHRLVQDVLIDQMDETEQRKWAKRSIKVISHVLPPIDTLNWDFIELLLPHAEKSVTLIEQWQFKNNNVLIIFKQTAFYLSKQARYQEAEDMFTKALKIYPQVKINNQMFLIKLWNGLAQVLYRQGKLKEAEIYYLKSLKTIDTEGEKRDLLISTLKDIAQLYRAMQRYEEAKSSINRLLDIVEDWFDADHPDRAMAYNELAELYRLQNKFDEAEPLYKRALELRENLLSENHPNIATTAKNLALLYYAQKNYSAAEELLKKAIKIRKKAFSRNHPEVAQPLNHLANVYFAQKRYDKAEPLYKRALSIRQESFLPNHDVLKESILNYVNFLKTVKRYDEARTLKKQLPK